MNEKKTPYRAASSAGTGGARASNREVDSTGAADARQKALSSPDVHASLCSLLTLETLAGGSPVGCGFCGLRFGMVMMGGYDPDVMLLGGRRTSSAWADVG